MDSLSLSRIQVKDLDVGQETREILGGGILVRVGVGGVAGVSVARLGGVCLGALARTARVLARAGISHNTVEGNIVRYGASATSLVHDTKGGLSTPTPVGWRTGR